jgi:hypothetical protein
MNHRIFLFLLSLTLLMSGCIKELKAPRWDAEFTLPLISDTYPVSDLVNDSTLVMEGDTLVYKVEDDLQSTPNDDFLQLHSQDAGWLGVLTNTTTSTENLGLDGASINGLGQTSDLRVSHGLIHSGLLRFDIERLSQLQSMTVTFENIYLPGSTANLQVALDQNNTNGFMDQYICDLAGYTLGETNDTTLLNNLPFSVSSVSYDNGMYDQLRVHYDEPLIFEHIEGEMQRITIPIYGAATDVEIEYPTNLSEALELKEATINFKVRNQLGFPIALVGTLSATGQNGEIRHINFYDETNPLSKYLVFEPNTWDSPQTLSLSDSIAYLLNSVPTRVEVPSFSACFLIVPQGYNGTGEGRVYGSANAGDIAVAHYETRAPAVFLLHQATLTPVQVDSLKISKDNRKFIRENANSGILSLTIDNRINAGGRFLLYFCTARDTAIIYTQSPGDYPDEKFLRFTDNLNLEPNQDDQHFELVLNPEDIPFFDNPMIYMGFRDIVHSSDGEYIVVQGADNLRVRSHLTLNAHIDGDN